MRGVHNLQVRATRCPAEMVQGRTRLLGPSDGSGHHPITGDYSRGAAGFWIEDGRIAYPVDGITIAGNLKTMFGAIEAVGDDIDLRSHVRMGSMLLGRMTVAGTG